MNYITIPETTLDALIEGLESSVKVCQNVDYSLSKKERNDPKNTEKTAPYAIGYTSSSLKHTIQNLKNLKSQEN